MSMHKKGNPIETKIRFRKKLRVSVVGPDVKARYNVAQCNVTISWMHPIIMTCYKIMLQRKEEESFECLPSTCKGTVHTHVNTVYVGTIICIYGCKVMYSDQS